jgi:hypothetical protein
MSALNHSEPKSMFDLIDALDRYADAGIDPAFDADCEELERQFAELRLQDRN